MGKSRRRTGMWSWRWSVEPHWCSDHICFESSKKENRKRFRDADKKYKKK
ncbi:Protein CBG27889 [Caenorhabditis briggsae]|uniref:Protein CBG27889 n=1 Tax=Caenorhabditis briggsae TaxID=6238 RepID=B6IEI4_CAEBR|nr:Protein CBG27889 [Caenorhabditis briggsae]CAR98314.1 Protein CBG27889 [Caenorhabditis briggsae]